jgi:hypothetical protein
VGVYLLARPWCKWVGEHDLTPLAADRGMTAAERTGNPAALGAAAWNVAQSLTTRGHTEAARAVAEDARRLINRDVGGRDGPLLSSWGALYLVGAVAATRDDDRADARRLMRAAGVAAARLGTDRNDWRLAFGPTNVAIHQVSLSTELGHSRAALRGAAGVLVEQSPSVERRVAHRLDMAQSHARLREDEAALRTLLDAETESPEQVAYSVTARESVAAILRRETKQLRPLLRPLARRLHLLS